MYRSQLQILLLLTTLAFSCKQTPKGAGPSEQTNDSASTGYNPVLSDEQQTALNALDRLQMNGSGSNRLYSTFANIKQPCYPPDATFHLSQAELLAAMQHFTAKHYGTLRPAVREKLTKESVLAQERYTVLHCKENNTSAATELEHSMTGTWVMPNILGRRDLTLIW